MTMRRRTFLKVAGLGLVGAGAGKVVHSRLARADAPAPVPAEAGALTASRWAMVVDTRRCKARAGCRECRLACHQAHNVPDLAEPKHEVKWIWTEAYRDVFASDQHEFMDVALRERPIAVLCNHCENPACVRVCPTEATFKRADGIVMMDWHRCVGCRYCVVACPYAARSFNWKDPRPFLKAQNPEFPTRTKGVVEKCTFCEERLRRGLLPACVIACREKATSALVFGDLDRPDSEVRRLLRAYPTARRKPGLGTGPKVYYIV